MAGGGGSVLRKIEGGGVFEKEARQGEGRWGDVCGGEGLNIFFGAEMPTKKMITYEQLF